MYYKDLTKNVSGKYPLVQAKNFSSSITHGIYSVHYNNVVEYGM